MSKFILSTDSGCDEFKTNLKKMDISYIPLCYIEGDIVHFDDYSTIEDYLFFYNELRQGKQFKTAGLNPYDLEEYFKGLLTSGKDVVHLTLSSGLSGTYEVTRGVAERLNQENENKIYVVDSKSATGGQSFILGALRKFRDSNLSAQEAFEQIKEVVDNLNVIFFVADLETLKRGGRISPLSATLGKVLQVKPLLQFDKEGKLQVVDKIMGSKKAIMKLTDKLSKNNIKEHTPIYLTHSDNIAMVSELVKLIETKVSNPVIIKNYIGPVIGSHTGPELLAIMFQTK